MRILAISDVHKWEGYERLVDEHRPDVVALAGDLTSDGGAAFWNDALEEIPAFRRTRDAAFKRKGITATMREGIRVISGGSSDDLHAIEDPLKQRYRASAAFARAHRKLHTEPFYAFLAYAGRRATVLVIEGDHDSDFPEDYDPQRINGIGGCREISGEVVRVDGVTFAGFHYVDGYQRMLRSVRQQYPDGVDVVIAHPRHKYVQLIAALRPRLLIRGHFGHGRYLIDGVPTVFTSGEHAVIDLGNSGLPHVQIYRTHEESFYRRQWTWLGEYPIAT